MERTIKIALVGAGMFGGDVHLRVEDWLTAAFQIDDAQPPHPQSKRSTAEIALVIGPAMQHRRRHTLDERSRAARTHPINCSANAAHDSAYIGECMAATLRGTPSLACSDA